MSQHQDQHRPLLKLINNPYADNPGLAWISILILCLCFFVHYFGAILSLITCALLHLDLSFNKIQFSSSHFMMIFTAVVVNTLLSLSNFYLFTAPLSLTIYLLTSNYLVQPEIKEVVKRATPPAALPPELETCKSWKSEGRSKHREVNREENLSMSSHG